MLKYISKLLIVITILCFQLKSFSKSNKYVIQQTFELALNQENVNYFTFYPNDELVFNFEGVGESMIQVEIIEWPNQTKFLDVNLDKLKDHQLKIFSKGVYVLKLINKGSSIFKGKLWVELDDSDREYKSSSRSVVWKNKIDTIYTQIEEKYLSKNDTQFVNLADQNISIPAKNTFSSTTNRNVVTFSLPENTVSWSYYIGVGNGAVKEFDLAKDRLVSTMASALMHITEYGPMAALALTGVAVFNKVHGEDNLMYWLVTDEKQLQLFMQGKTPNSIKQGNVINEAAQIKKPLDGYVAFAMINDNLIQSIKVLCKVTAVTVVPIYQNRFVLKPSFSQSIIPFAAQ